MGANATVAKACAAALAMAISLGATSSARALATSPAIVPLHTGCVLDARTERNLETYANISIFNARNAYFSEIKRVDAEEEADVAAQSRQSLKAMIRHVREDEKRRILEIRYFEINKMEVLKSKIQIRFTCGTSFGSSRSIWDRITVQIQKIQERANSKVKQTQQRANDSMNIIYSK